ncbi:hypothetical protein TrST_g7794 [Triparma strigata]|uniref:Enoyl reductase (ER) domain-containing protein n=1 Tax=Triparma strigata TaxID=1606541 RepID=A0A9W7B5E9_9STRA|nr:hypothetical protein TrST_g7794 [Triparma strigata]
MKAAFYSEHGTVDVLDIGTQPRPVLKSNQVLVKAEYASLNPCDFKFRRAKIPLSFVSDFLFPKPKIPAVDVSGLVVSVGSDVTNLSVGDRVAATQPIIHTRWGTLAEFSAVDASHAAIVPASISLRDAAAVSLVGLTAVQALSNVKTKRGDRILIHAGSGGLGSFAVQWASKVLKLNVSATASSKNQKFLSSLGAHNPIDYGLNSWDKNSPNYDVILDPMSYAYEKRTLSGDSNVISPTGHYLNIASSSWDLKGGVEEANGLSTYTNIFTYGVKNFLSRIGLKEKGVSYSFVAVEPCGEQLAMIFKEIEDDNIRAVVDSEFEFNVEGVREAYRRLETGRAKGKILVKMTF